MFYETGNLTLTLLANYPEFPDSCLGSQFFLLIEVLQVLVDRANIAIDNLIGRRGTLRLDRCQ
jgi:hypothetical protein